MVLHTTNGFEYDSENPNRFSFVLRYAEDNPKYNIARLEYKPKSLTKTQAIFRYVEGVTHGSATFLYSSNVFLDKPRERYLESDSTSEIVIDSTKLLKRPLPFEISKASSSKGIKRNSPSDIWKSKSQLLSPELRGLYKAIGKLLRETICSQIWIEKPRLFSRFIPSIIIKGGKLLRGFIPQMWIESNRFLGRFILEMYIQTSQELGYIKSSEMWIKSTLILDREYQRGIIKTQSWELEINTPRLMSQALNIPLQDMLRELYTTKSLGLRGNNLRSGYRTKNHIGLYREKLKYIDKPIRAFGLRRTNLKLCDIEQSRSLDILQIYNMSKDKAKLLRNSGSKLVDIFKLQLLSKSNVVNMLKPFEPKGLRRVNFFRVLKDKTCKLLSYTPLVGITHNKGRKFTSKVNEFRITKFKHINSLKKVNVFRFSKMKLPEYLDKLNLTRITKSKVISVAKNILFPVYKKSDKSLSKNGFNIYIDSQRGVSKTNPLPIDPNTKITSLKVIKRWWIVPEGSDYDSKILPSDYDYGNYPLVGSYGLGYKVALPKDIDSIIENIKLKYFNDTGLATPYDFIPQVYNQHPNIVNPYMEHDDGNVGIYEIPLAINIMMEMVNLVGLIFHHEASQLCYCTGQEAMWFIMEMLDDWLNMESTIKELDRLGVMEQYHRTYRWVRWEAEKVYFDDRASNRFTGLKAAGQLLANLIEYMKLHHFNIVPMWKDLSKMDYWRNQSNRDNTPVDDISLQLSKIKGKRHLNIEAQKLDRTLNESIPTEK